MINRRRVQRIRNCIYAFIVLLIVIPVIVMIVLCYRMVGVMGDLNRYLQQPSSISSQLDEPSGISADPQGFQPESASQSGSDGQGQEETIPEDGLAEPTGTVANTYRPSAFPDLYYDTVPTANTFEENTLFLTFDNTPSYQAGDILAVLEQHGVKATFFVWWNDNNLDFYREIVDAGHSIGIHSYSSTDEYDQLYASVDAFLENYSKIHQKLRDELGVDTRLYRLPGGSVHPGDTERQETLRKIREELDARGFIQYDWNSSAEDAIRPPLTKSQILSNMERSIGDSGHFVVLMHDGTGSQSTAKALDEFIEKYKEAGYQFKALAQDTAPVSFLW